MAATATAPATASNAQAAPPPAAPFRAGTFNTVSQDGYSVSQTLGSAAVQLANYTPSPNAYLRGIYIQAVCTAATNSANVAFNADAPWNVYQTIVFQDANEKPIVGPFDGYTLMVVNKYGGYSATGDPRASAIYSATTGTGATGGSFTFVLYVPLEIVARDGLGALQNKSSSSSFQLQLTVNTEANVYSTNPTNAPSLVTTCYEDGWVQPRAADSSGTPLSQAPPQLGTTQYWTRGSYAALNGSVQVQLTQGLGYPIRNYVGICYDTSGTTRATGQSDFPSPAQFLFKGTSMWNISATLWGHLMSQAFQYTSTTKDAALGLENGVFALPFDRDFGLKPGAELRNGYLSTQQGDQFQLLGSFGGSCTLYWIANYVAPVAGANNLASIRAGR